jgi:putative SOS response-associated peptidase YedK
VQPIHRWQRRGSPGSALSCASGRQHGVPHLSCGACAWVADHSQREPPGNNLRVWGFLPAWADGRRDVKRLIHARAETAATTPFFRQAFRTKRCLVLTDGFDAWKRAGRGKVPYRIALKTEEPFAFAGFWSTGHDAQDRASTTFAILTTEANALVAQVHDRMPVILHPQDDAAWLNPATAPEQAQACLKPFPAELLTLSAVSPQVHSPTHNTPDLLQRMLQTAPGGAAREEREAPDAGVLCASVAMPSIRVHEMRTGSFSCRPPGTQGIVIEALPQRRIETVGQAAGQTNRARTSRGSERNDAADIVTTRTHTRRAGDETRTRHRSQARAPGQG